MTRVAIVKSVVETNEHNLELHLTLYSYAYYDQIITESF